MVLPIFGLLPAFHASNRRSAECSLQRLHISELVSSDRVFRDHFMDFLVFGCLLFGAETENVLCDIIKET